MYYYVWKEEKSEKVVVVTTKEELKAAIESKKPCIEVQGNLARKMKWMTKLNRAAVIALIPALVAIGGVSAGFAVPASFVVPATATAVGITAGDILLCTLSISIIIAILKGYSIEADAKGIVRFTKNR